MACNATVLARIILLAALTASVTSLSGCGNKGDLFLPEPEQQEDEENS